jgi:hypothetical protein
LNAARTVSLLVTRKARAARRHREFFILVALLTAGVVAILGTGATNTPRAVFVHDPYMGVSCHIANSIACDRVGLSVWLARPAAVTATIDGAPLRLDDPQWSYATRLGGKPLYVYAGFLHPAGITTRLRARDSLVRFRIDYGHGDVVTRQEHVLLHAGWG